MKIKEKDVAKYISTNKYLRNLATITQIWDQILINAVHNLLNNLRRFIQRLPFFFLLCQKISS